MLWRYCVRVDSNIFDSLYSIVETTSYRSVAAHTLKRRDFRMLNRLPLLIFFCSVCSVFVRHIHLPHSAKTQLHLTCPSRRRHHGSSHDPKQTFTTTLATMVKPITGVCIIPPHLHGSGGADSGDRCSEGAWCWILLLLSVCRLTTSYYLQWRGHEVESTVGLYYVLTVYA